VRIEGLLPDWIPPLAVRAPVSPDGLAEVPGLPHHAVRVLLLDGAGTPLADLRLEPGGPADAPVEVPLPR
jgi:hypothetical protein